MSSFSEKAYDFLVKVKYEPNGDNSEGSAVIIPIDNADYAYILTAKHTFGIDKSQRRDDTYHTIDITNIKREDTELNHPKNKFQILEVLNLTYDKYIDLIIFKIKKDEYIDKLSSLNIYEEKFTKALVYGYPTMREEDIISYQAIDGTYRRIDLKNKFELHLNNFPNIDEKQDTQEYVAGLSGAGVFVEDSKKEEIYLSGIVVNSSKGNSIKCIDILALSKIINNKLEEKKLKPIGISGAKWKNEFGFDMSDLDFQKVITDLSDKNKRNKFIQELNQYHDEPTKFMEVFDKSVKFDLQDEEKKLSEVSDIYLYLGMNFHEFKENKRATHYFNKAIKYGGVQNKTYLFDAKSKRSKNNNKIKENNDTENEFIENTVNALYENIYELEEQLNIDKENSTIKKILMESYRDIILKLGLLADNDERIQKCRNRLLELYDDFKEYDYIKEEISDLKSRIDLNEQFEGMKNQVDGYKQEIENLNKHIQLLSTNSTNLSVKIDKNTNEITKKLDEITTSIIKTNNQKLNIFLENVYRSNQSLVSKIQTMYHQNDRVNKKAKIALDNSIKSMNEKIEECLNKPIPIPPYGQPISEGSNNNQVDIEKIIKESNWSFYNAIQGLYEKGNDSYTRKLLEMSIAFTKKEHELHIENLRKSHQNEILEIDKRNQKELVTLEERMRNLVESVNSLTLKYGKSKNVSIEKENEFNILKREYEELEMSFKNDSNTNLTEKAKEIFQENIKVLSTKIVKLENDLLLKEKDVELKENEFKRKLSSIKLTKSEENLKESLELSNKTSWNLLKLDDRYEEKIKKLEDKLNEIKFNPKNKKRLRKFLKKILNFEKKLDEIKRRGDVYPIKGVENDPKITLRLLERDLEKIEKIMSERKLTLYYLYLSTRFVIIGVIGMVMLLMHEPFGGIQKLILEFLGLI